MSFGEVDAAGNIFEKTWWLLQSGWRWGKQTVQGDHSTIAGCGGMERDYSQRFVARVCVAPTRAVKPVPAVDLAARALVVAREVFGDLPYMVDYSGEDLVRFVVMDDGGEFGPFQRHQLEVFGSGLLDLHWGLHMAVVNEVADPLPLAEVVAVIGRVHRVVQGSVYRNLYRKRWSEKRRRHDWRIGVSGRISTIKGQVVWQTLDVPGSDSFARAERRYADCPRIGFAAERLLSRKPDEAAITIVRPVLEELLMHAGYLDVKGSVAAIVAHHQLDAPPRPALA
ncbi:hypothetical protein [Streptomyces sp. NBC_00620]|uniref:hypothetical protein n=1 Tax=Streptomyces sp. NBC_00620 TaxID=2903666 RepID=UPI00225B9D01|nr:hypothetical protein [Streptomyces sp. NBC_00620]MCX4976257.1 hypothetical protein [Streptomyces sp. NBC_00620]